MKLEANISKQPVNRQAIIILAVLFLLVCERVATAAESPSDVLVRANTAYRSGNYKDAQVLYQNVAKNQPSADVFYNIANSAFKSQKLGVSILNYERARRLSPRDQDILENLKVAKSFIEYRVEDKRNWYYQELTKLLEMVRFEELLVVALTIYLLWLILILIPLVLKREKIFSEVSVYFLWLLIIISVPTVIKFYQARIQDKAVVIQPKVEAYFAPSEKEKVAFRLVEGISVDVADQIENWYRVSLVNGDTGWVKKDGIEIV